MKKVELSSPPAGYQAGLIQNRLAFSPCLLSINRVPGQQVFSTRSISDPCPLNQFRNFEKIQNSGVRNPHHPLKYRKRNGCPRGRATVLKAHYVLISIIFVPELELKQNEGG